jgi:geranylgeranyl diphosphate synthase, type II
MSKLSDKKKFPRTMERYKASVDKRLHAFLRNNDPESVYDPIKYVISSGGKRLRAILLLLSSETVGAGARSALDAACAIELLHNFTLVHDDIMDKSDLRRGMPTVHKKWTTDVAILSGDQIAACAYDILLKTKTARLADVLRVFTNAFVEVCEGQGYDKEFEERDDLSINDYRMMIGKKTARLISAAAEMGAMIGGGSTSEVNALRHYGENLGLAFQIQDDILDIDGSEKKFGKSIGRDIIEGKRTFLLLTALERARGSDRKLVQSVMRRERCSEERIKRMREMYNRLGVLADAHKEIERYTGNAQKMLRRLPKNQAASTLLWLSNSLLQRQS